MGRDRGVSPRKVALATLLLIAALGGCLGARNTYVSNSATQTYFKLPAGWKVYSQQENLKNLSLPTSSSKTFPFLVTFDGDPHPSIDHQIGRAAFPFGIARVRSLDLRQHDEFSFASLRNEIFKIDDALNANANAIDVIRPPHLIVHKSLRGSRLEYTVHNPDGTSFSVDQVGMVDTPTKRVWFLALGCSVDCYRHNAAAIHRIVDSWTVQGR